MGIKSTEDYHRVLKYFPPMEEPSFESEEMMEFVWGRRWGCNSEVGRLKTVLMRRPDHEMDVITMDKWDDEIGAIMGEITPGTGAATASPIWLACRSSMTITPTSFEKKASR